MADRLEKLKELEDYLYEQLREADAKSVAAIAKQYRETIREIEEIEGDGTENDEIKEILGFRSESGKPGAVRKDRTEVQ
jgi:hypothetical protein